MMTTYIIIIKISPVVNKNLSEVRDVACLGFDELGEDVLAPDLVRLAALIGGRGGSGGVVVDRRPG